VTDYRKHVRRAAIFFDAEGAPAAIQVVISDQAYERVCEVLGEKLERPWGLMMLTLDQAQKLALWAGRQRPAPSEYEVTAAIYYCLVGGFFNRFWEDGVDGAARGEEPYE
jgi:hypothetical protein